MRVAYLGPKGTFTEQAARKVFPRGELVPLPSVYHVFKKVGDEEFESGVVPIENIHNGEVKQTLDAFVEYPVPNVVGKLL